MEVEAAAAAAEVTRNGVEWRGSLLLVNIAIARATLALRGEHGAVRACCVLKCICVYLVGWRGWFL